MRGRLRLLGHLGGAGFGGSGLLGDPGGERRDIGGTDPPHRDQVLLAVEDEGLEPLEIAPDFIRQAARYRAGDYERAIEDFAQEDSSPANYNRGNALANMGELDGAIAAYDRALELEPGMPDAEHNKAIVEQMKQQQEQEQQGDQGETGESESEDQQEGEQSEQSEGQEGEEGESQEEQGEQDGEQSESEGEQGRDQQQMDFSESWSEEDAQAMEQWLRRIPDDPGGLLRRKFRNQHQRRGAPEDEKESW